MGNIQVTTTVQPIYPDGYQDSFVIRNNGPYIIYVGQDTAVNTDSIPVPPSGTLAWDAQRPLYMVATPLAGVNHSSVSIDRNSEAPVFGNAFDALLFTKQFNAINCTTGNLLECTAFNSLIVTLYSSVNILNGAAITDLTRYDVLVSWYDSSGNFICSDTAQMPFHTVNNDPGNNGALPNEFPTPGSNTAFANRLMFKVKGSYCWVAVASNGADLTLNVIGTTRELPPRMSWSKPDLLPQIGAGLSGFTFYVASGMFSIQEGTAGYNYADVVLPNIGRKWQVSIRNSAAITVAGLLSVRSAFNASFGIQTFPIAVIGAAGVQTFEFDVPPYDTTMVSIPSIPQSAGPVNLAGCQMTFLCLDYDQ